MIRAATLTGIAIVILSGALGYVTRAQPQAEATDAIAKQIGWLVIQNANLQAQIEDMKKNCAKPGEPNK